MAAAMTAGASATGATMATATTTTMAGGLTANDRNAGLPHLFEFRAARGWRY
jgi:hypothetical protein